MLRTELPEWFVTVSVRIPDGWGWPDVVAEIRDGLAGTALCDALVVDAMRAEDCADGSQAFHSLPPARKPAAPAAPSLLRRHPAPCSRLPAPCFPPKEGS